jgi:hypothetical protein
MVKCPNGCKVPPDTYIHVCPQHTHAIENGMKFVCKIKNCKYKKADHATP